MIRITFLGTVSGIPSIDRNQPAICLEYLGKSYYCFLFDCGENTQVQFMKSETSFMNIDCIFITHWHADHFAGLIPLIQTLNLEKRNRPLIVFGPDAERMMKAIYSISYYKPKFEIVFRNVNYEKKEITKIFESNDIEVLSVPVEHTIPAVAYCVKEKDKYNINITKLRKMKLKRGKWLEEIKKKGKYVIDGREIKIEEIADLKIGKKIVYSGDTRPCKEIIEIARDADILIHDATFFEEEDVDGLYHADFKQAMEIARKANVKLLVLTHISRRYRDIDELEKEAKKYFENCVVARDLMKIILKKNETKIFK
ncbi:MAG: ribonuclease Z [Candidatus Aenigmarchaeota archaeon]|nr:ribonuclease Z [Candidatus Aenigmarchaeota archaeon]MDW8149695.1 ribonuclease Z [Candidatus Aenigmarchaeota archaeon]